MRKLLIVPWLVWGSLASAFGQVSVGIGVAIPGVSIGINVPAYPSLEPVPGYPVYYAPQSRSNYFFYDGMYWVFQGDNWYASSWYNGPWWVVEREVVPVFILRVPVRYYGQPPAYFRRWRPEAPPRWGEHWGNDWEQRHRDWDRWDRRAAPRPAPLPTYQRQYSGTRYPHPEQQPALQGGNYRYEPRDAVVQQHYQVQRQQVPAPAALEPQGRVVPAARENRPPQAADAPTRHGATPPGQTRKRDNDDAREAGRRGGKE
jgi:general stress protein YciG